MASKRPSDRDTAEPQSEELHDGVRDFARLHVWHIQAVRDVLFVAAVVALVWAGYMLRAVTVPLLIALLLAYLFEPLVARFARHPKVTRPLVVGSLIAVVGLAALAIGAVAVPIAVSQTAALVEDIGEGRFAQRLGKARQYIPEAMRDDFETILNVLPVDETLINGEDATDGESDTEPAESTTVADAPDESPMTPDEVRAYIDAQVAARMEADEDSYRGMLTLARRSIDFAIGVIGSIVGFALLAFIIPFYFFFFSVWYPSVVRFGRNLLPEKNKKRTLELLRKMDEAVAGFVRGRIVISLIMGVMLAIGWMICGVPYSIILGLVVGILCAVPYLGVAGVPAAVGLLALQKLGGETDMGWIAILIWPTVVFAIVQFIEGYFLTPMIAGKATNLDPVTILVAVLAGGSVMGVYGMLLAIPLAACGKIVFTEILLPKIRAWAEGEAADPLPIDNK